MNYFTILILLLNIKIWFKFMICKKCGKEHDGSYGSGQFCSKECARSYATLNEKNKHQLKEAKCINCGKIIYIDKRASLKNCKCNECNKKICKICGNSFIGSKSQTICSNECKHINKILPTLIKYFDFNDKTIGTKNIFNEILNIKIKLFNLYWIENKSLLDIAKLFNYPYCNNLSKIFEYFNLDKRSYIEATKNAYIQNKLGLNNINCHNGKWHTTWNNKEVYLRSSYELDYAKELDEQQIDYDVEHFHIKYWDSQKHKYRCAIPDFYIPSTNTIVEIKSSWTLDEQNMKDKMRAYKELGYNTNLICDHKEINF